MFYYFNGTGLQKSLYYGIVFDGDVHCTLRLGYSNLQNKKLCFDFFSSYIPDRSGTKLFIRSESHSAGGVVW